MFMPHYLIPYCPLCPHSNSLATNPATFVGRKDKSRAGVRKISERNFGYVVYKFISLSAKLTRGGDSFLRYTHFISKW